MIVFGKKGMKTIAALLALVLAIGIWPPLQGGRAYADSSAVIVTLAGSGIGPDRAAVDIGQTPIGVAVFGSYVYVADRTNHVIRRIDKSTGIESVVAGIGFAGVTGDGGPAASARLQSPSSLAVDADGNLYVAGMNDYRVRKIATDGTITTVAGIGQYGYSGDDGPATEARISPQGIAIDAEGNLYIADSGNHRVRKVDAVTGTITTVAGTGTSGFSGDNGPATTARLNSPSGVAFDDAGNLYIADMNNKVVRKVTPSGTITTIAGVAGTYGDSGDNGPATSAKLSSPGKLVYSSGYLYISDYNANRVRKVNLSSGIISTAAGTGAYGYSGDNGPAASAQLNYPQGIAIDGSNNLYIADGNNNRVRMVSDSGLISTIAGNGSARFAADGPASQAELYTPSAIAFDGAGNLYIAETQNNRVLKVDPFGNIVTFAGTGTAGFDGDGGSAASAQLNFPSDVTVDGDGNVYIADTQNRRIRKVDTLGTITTVAGNGTFGFSGDEGAALDAQLSSPTGIALDGNDLYIADNGNQRVRKVNGQGIITTVAGDGGYNSIYTDGAEATSVSVMPNKIAVDDGNLYIVETFYGRIHKVDADGKISKFAGTGGSGYAGDGASAKQALLNYPYGMAVDSDGNVYIADGNNHRIRVVDAEGIIQTVAGTGTAGYSGDNGPPAAAQLSYPQALAFDRNGNLAIADYGNFLIRQIRLPQAALELSGIVWGPGSGLGTTQATAVPTIPVGNTLKYVVGGPGDKTRPMAGEDAAALGYQDELMVNDDIAVSEGQHIYVVETDADGNIQAWTDVTVEAENIASDVDAPAYEPGYPRLGTVTDTSATVKVKTDEAGVVYYVAVPKGSQAPSAEQVRAGSDAEGNTVDSNRKGTAPMAAGEEVAVKIAGLLAGTDYDVM